MKNQPTFIKSVSIAIAGAAVIGTTALFASSKYSDEDAALANSPVSIEQAMATATNAIPGTVVEVEFEVEDNKNIWEVELIGEDKQRYELEIDATSGKILSQEKDDH